jgi:MFS transporter, UMF1 family
MKKNLISWLVYDFGNSFFMTAISGLFLAQWLILDNKLDDIWYGAGFSIATICVLITSPFFGAWSDRLGKRMLFLKWTSAVVFIFNGLLAIVAVSDLPKIYRAFIVLGLSIVVQYAYQLSLIFYSALLKEVSTEKSRGKISGIGEGMGNLGWLFGSVVLLPFANGAIALIGEPGRAQVFIPAFVISTLLMLPMLFLFKEELHVKEDKDEPKETLGKKTFAGFKQLFRENKNVGIFLVAFALISDIVLTITLYFGVLMDALYRIDDNTKTMAFGIELLCMMFFGYLLGMLGDKYGHKLMLFIACIVLTIGAVIFFFSSSLAALYLSMIITGIGGGGYFVLSKSLMIKISPPKQLGEYFGFYSTFGRTASVIAPLIWGGITLALRNYPILKYQIAGVSLLVILILGTFILSKVKEEAVPENCD